MALYTKYLVAHNKMSDKVKVIHEFAEDVSLDENVDVIVSEWMGTFLLVHFCNL